MTNDFGHAEPLCHILEIMIVIGLSDITSIERSRSYSPLQLVVSWSFKSFTSLSKEELQQRYRFKDHSLKQILSQKHVYFDDVTNPSRIRNKKSQARRLYLYASDTSISIEIRTKVYRGSANMKQAE